MNEFALDHFSLEIHSKKKRLLHNCRSLQNLIIKFINLFVQNKDPDKRNDKKYNARYGGWS